VATSSPLSPEAQHSKVWRPWCWAHVNGCKRDKFILICLKFAATALPESVCIVHSSQMRRVYSSTSLFTKAVASLVVLFTFRTSPAPRGDFRQVNFLAGACLSRCKSGWCLFTSNHLFQSTFDAHLTTWWVHGFLCRSQHLQLVSKQRNSVLLKKSASFLLSNDCTFILLRLLNCVNYGTLRAICHVWCSRYVLPTFVYVTNLSSFLFSDVVTHPWQLLIFLKACAYPYQTLFWASANKVRLYGIYKNKVTESLE